SLFRGAGSLALTAPGGASIARTWDRARRAGCRASAPSRSCPLRLGLLLQLQDVPAHGLEALFDHIAEQRVLAVGQRRRDLRPVLRLQCSDRSRKEVTLLHQDMLPLMRDEVAHDGIYGRTRNLTVHQHAL